MTFALLIQSMVIGLSLGSTYILMALGLTLMFGMMHIINFTHGAVYMLGAFVIYYFFGQWGVPYVLARSSWPCSAGSVWLCDRALYLSPNQRWDRTYSGGPYRRDDVCASHAAILSLARSISTCRPCFMGCIPSWGRYFCRTPEHHSYRECARPRPLPVHQQDQDGGRHARHRAGQRSGGPAGVNVNVVNALAFGVGFALAAASGALMAPIFKLDPMMGEQPLLKAFIIIILGELGSIPGAILGGLILGQIDSIVATLLGLEPAFLLSFVFIILLLLFKPTGLFGHEV